MDQGYKIKKKCSLTRFIHHGITECVYIKGREREEREKRRRKRVGKQIQDQKYEMCLIDAHLNLTTTLLLSFFLFYLATAPRPPFIALGTAALLLSIAIAPFPGGVLLRSVLPPPIFFFFFFFSLPPSSSVDTSASTTAV